MLINKLLYKNIYLAAITIMLTASLMSCTASIQYRPAINDPLELSAVYNGQISLLSYNIQAIFGKEKIKLDALMDYIHLTQYDFVVFQELFDEAAREYILSNIDANIYQSVVSRVDYQSFPELLFQDAGLFMISKYPQVDLSGINFDDNVQLSDGAVHMILTKELSITTDFLANKSIVGSLYQLPDSTYFFLFTTHVQAIGSKTQKRRQYRQIKEFIDYVIFAVLKSGTIKSSENMSVVLAGDFNTDAYDQKNMERLLTDLGSPRELLSEKHASKKEYTMIFKLFNMYKRFDYIFSYDQILDFPLKKIEAKSINATDIRDNNEESVSDHMALKASLVFNTESEKKLNSYTKERQAK